MRVRFLKFTLTVVLLAGLLANAHWANSRIYLAQVSGIVMVLALALLGAGLAVSTCKWGYALRLQSLQYPFWYLFKALCIGFFLNNFLPTSIGGDAYRVYRTLPHERRSRAVGAVIVERVVGLAALLSLGAMGALLTEQHAAITTIYLNVFAVCALAVVIAWAVLAYGDRRGWFMRSLDASQIMRTIRDGLAHLRGAPGAWVMLAALSFAFQMLSITVIYLLFRDITAQVSWLQCGVIAAIVGVAASLPVSVNGVGIAEGALVAAALALKLDYDQALVVAIVRRVLAVGLSVFCGLLYLGEQHARTLRAQTDPALNRKGE